MNFNITERCNMRCAHCSASATPDGRDMPFEMFLKGVAKFGPRIKARDEPFNLGFTGEVTVHPQFSEMLDILLSEKQRVVIMTNGKITEAALKLGEMAKRGLLTCVLSQDQWHEPIDPKVVEFFKDGLRPRCHYYQQHDKHITFLASKDPQHDKREIQETYIPMAFGRAKSIPNAIPLCAKVLDGRALPLEQRKHAKCTPRLILEPDGRIFVCGGRFGCSFTCPCSPVPMAWQFGDIDDPDEKFDEIFNLSWKCYEFGKKPKKDPKTLTG